MNPTTLREMGVATIPVLPGTKRPSVRWQRYQTQLPTPAELARWFRPGRRTNVAVVCGWQGLTVLDFDAMPAYIAWRAWTVVQGGAALLVAQHTYRVRTSRGMHVYLFVDDTPRCGKAKGCDVKGKGGYVLMPPSVHPSGAIYSAVDESAPILRVASLDEVVEDAPAPARPPLPPVSNVYPMSQLWPGTLIDDIKAQLSLLAEFPDARPTGGRRWFVAHCPFHDDRHESLWIDAERGICFCYAGCFDKPVDVIGLYAKRHGLTNKQAIRELAKQVSGRRSATAERDPWESLSVAVALPAARPTGRPEGDGEGGE